MKGFAYQIQKKSDFASQINLSYFMDILQSGQFVELRDTPYGENKCRATKKDDREYKDFVMLFFWFQAVVETNKKYFSDLRNFFIRFSRVHTFFILMESFTQTLPYEGMARLEGVCGTKTVTVGKS